MHHLIKLLLVLTVISCSTSKVVKKPILDKIRIGKVLKVGTTFDYAPFTYKKDGKPAGSDIERARMLAKSLGVEVEFVQTTWKTLMQDLQADKFHIAMGGISVKPERKKVGFFSTPYLNNGKLPIALCSLKFRYNSLDNINMPHVRTIVNPGGTNYDFAIKNLKKSKLTIHPDNNTIFKEILRGRADVMITDSAEVHYQAKISKGKLCATMTKPLTKGYLAYYLPIDREWKAYVDGWLEKLLK